MPNGQHEQKTGPPPFGPYNPRGFDDFMPCLLSGLMHAMPYFLEAFLACIAGSPPNTGYKPGDRPRC
jgi:hypothetical protein